MKKEQIIVVIILVVVLVIAGGIFFMQRSSVSENEQTQGASPLSVRAEQGFGSLCSGREECITFCHTNRGQCEKYCKNNKNELCTSLFQSGIESCKDKKEFFTMSPINLQDLESIIPLGSLNPPDHTLPTDHIYMNVKDSLEIPGAPMKAKVFSPGEIHITKITSSEYLSANPPFTDYNLEFYPCKEVFGKFGHVTPLSEKLQSYFKNVSGKCESYTMGEKNITRCDAQVNIDMHEGEEIGTTGGFAGAARGLDFWLADYRKERLLFVNPSRWLDISFYISCPLDYFTSDVQNTFYPHFANKNTVSEKEKICGTIEQDVEGSAQGSWFVKNTKENSPKDLHFALAPYNIDATKQVFSIGASMPGLESNKYLFEPERAGYVNRNFNEVLLGNIYCYDSLKKKFDTQASPFRILMQLTNNNTLRIEKQDESKCGNGPWTFGSSFIDFER